MNCPLCQTELDHDPDYPDMDYCPNMGCVFGMDSKSQGCWETIQQHLIQRDQKSVEEYKAKEAPKWRKIDLNEMLKCLPVVVKATDRSNAVFVDDALVCLGVVEQLTPEIKPHILWTPVPKMEETK